MPRRRQPIDWPDIIKRIQKGESQQSVADAHGIARQTLAKRGTKEGWLNGQTKWLQATMQTQMAKRLQSPQTLADKANSVRGNRDPQVAASVLADVERGVAVTRACPANGIAYETWNDWRKAEPELNRLYRKARHTLLGNVEATIPQAAMRGDWKAAESYLRSAPESRQDWGQTGAGGPGGITVNITLRSDNSHPTVDITPDRVLEAKTDTED